MPDQQNTVMIDMCINIGHWWSHTDNKNCVFVNVSLMKASSPIFDGEYGKNTC